MCDIFVSVTVTVQQSTGITDLWYHCTRCTSLLSALGGTAGLTFVNVFFEIPSAHMPSPGLELCHLFAVLHLSHRTICYVARFDYHLYWKPQQTSPLGSNWIINVTELYRAASLRVTWSSSESLIVYEAQSCHVLIEFTNRLCFSYSAPCNLILFRFFRRWRKPVRMISQLARPRCLWLKRRWKFDFYCCLCASIGPTNIVVLSWCLCILNSWPHFQKYSAQTLRMLWVILFLF